MKNILIACANRDEFEQKKANLILTSEKEGKMVKWSDYAIETTEAIYTFKVVEIPNNFFDDLKGYDEVQAEKLSAVFMDRVSELPWVEIKDKEQPIPVTPENEAPKSVEDEIVDEIEETTTNEENKA